MIEIKFRIWDFNNKKFVDDIFLNMDRILLCDNGMTLYGDQKFDVQLFTGIKDKNGKEIYEGDIVSIIYAEIELIDIFNNISSNKEQDTDQVIFYDKESRFKLKKYSEFLYELELEIIGNIYNDKKLLDNK